MTSHSLSHTHTLSLSAGILTMRCGISGTAQRSWNQSDWQALSGFTHWGSRWVGGWSSGIYTCTCRPACIYNIYCTSLHYIYTHAYKMYMYMYIHTCIHNVNDSTYTRIQMYTCTHMVCCHTLSLVVWVGRSVESPFMPARLYLPPPPLPLDRDCSMSLDSDMEW